MNAPRADVYRALLDPRATARWKTGMTCHVHASDAREGGSFRRFVKLVPNEQVVEAMEFEAGRSA